MRWCVAGAATATTVPHAVVLEEEELLRCSLMRSCRRERKVPLWLLRRMIMMMMIVLLLVLLVLVLVLLVLVLPVRRLVLRVGL